MLGLCLRASDAPSSHMSRMRRTVCGAGVRMLSRSGLSRSLDVLRISTWGRMRNVLAESGPRSIAYGEGEESGGCGGTRMM
eukprot:7104143-Prymnesium_polylepis.1